jgi:threonine aldolase
MAASRGLLKIEAPQTNILWAEAPSPLLTAFTAHLKSQGVLVSSAYGRQRWVTHLDVSRNDVERAVEIASDFFAKSR